MPEDHNSEPNGKRYESDRTVYSTLLPLGTPIYDAPPSNLDSGATILSLLSPVKVKYKGEDLRVGDDVRLLVINDRHHDVPVGLKLYQEVFIWKRDLPRARNEYREENSIDVRGVEIKESSSEEPQQLTFPETDAIPQQASNGTDYYKKGL